jgi:hypothetical protein
MPVIKLGIDFGTSASKVVARDDTRAYALDWESESDDAYRLTSDVVVVKDGRQKNAWFGSRSDGDLKHIRGTDPVWFKSLKMRVAEDFRASPESDVPADGLPRGWTRKHLMIALLVWISRRSMINAIQRHRVKARSVSFEFMFGLPHDFRLDQTLRSSFLHAFRAAKEIAGDPKKLPHITEPKSCLTLNATSRRTIDAAWNESVNRGEEDIDDWHQSEARASAMWAWNTPGFGRGSYINVDIGAGTTNAVAYLVAAEWVDSRQTLNNRVRGEWIPNRISVFGAKSGDVGVDRIDDDGALDAGPKDELLSTFRDPYRQAWDGVKRLTAGNGVSQDQWRDAKVVMLGGGSFYSSLVNCFLFHPLIPGLALQAHEVSDWPPDLDMNLGTLRSLEQKRNASMLARGALTVAYGLASDVATIGLMEAKDIGPAPPDVIIDYEARYGIWDE